MESFLTVVQCRRDAAASRPLPTDDALATLELHGAVCQIGAEDNQLGSGTSHDEECVICFDAIAERLVLPCECRVSYCLGCWDRALAASFNSSGRARCPTCRTPVRVNFDPEAAGGRGRLVFSAENEGDESEERSDVVNRLAEQAAPLMTRLLRLHGETHPLLDGARPCWLISVATCITSQGAPTTRGRRPGGLRCKGRHHRPLALKGWGCAAAGRRMRRARIAPRQPRHP